MFGRDEGGANHARTNGVVTGLAAFFAVMYFVQGLGDPTSGLIAQPVRSLLREWGESPSSIAAFMAVLAIPWTLKPLFGLLSDYLPLFGSRRRGYLLLATASAAVGLFVLWLTPLPEGERWLLFVLLLVPTVGIAFGDVLVDALMIERGQPLGLTGRLQSIQWTAAYLALLLTGVVAGYLANNGLQTVAFGICAALWAGTFVLAWFYAREPSVARAPHSAAELRRALAAPGLAAVVLIQFLWSMNPLWVSVLYLHVTEALGFSEQVYGNTYSLFSAGCVLASVGYAFYCRRVRMGVLLHVSIVTGIAANAVYWSMSTAVHAYLISFVAGWAYMTGMLIQLDLAARVVPIGVAATLFALIMALTNFAASLSEALGGHLYEFLQTGMSELAAYRWVVLLSMLFAASCWLVVPSLRRAQPQWWWRGAPLAGDEPR
ncbi:MAG TPA: MFS transporter [Pseudomonadales bacterium]